jgi:hypothetical protein
MQKEIRSWAEKSHDRDDGNLTGVYVQIKGHRVWLSTSEAADLELKIGVARKEALRLNR